MVGPLVPVFLSATVPSGLPPTVSVPAMVVIELLLPMLIAPAAAVPIPMVGLLACA